ncbi:MAG: hypothetical protein VX771_05275, partial [Pseudomonadota bacterium]|nr:hypothetical protein [Pseudomonadota bacterium]
RKSSSPLWLPTTLPHNAYFGTTRQRVHRGGPALIKKVMDQHSVVSADSLDAVLSADSWARATAESFLQEESL